MPNDQMSALFVIKQIKMRKNREISQKMAQVNSLKIISMQLLHNFRSHPVKHMIE